MAHFLKQGTVYHLQVCPLLGRNSATHDAVRDMLSHLVVENGVTDAAAVETRLTAAYGETFDADLGFFDPSSRERVTYWKYRLVYILRCIAGGVPLGMGCAQMPHFHK